MQLSRFLFTSAVILLIASQTALGDLKVREKSKNSGFAGIGASESEQVVYVAADKSKTTTSTRFTGGVVGFFAGKKPRTKTEIIRLDKEVMWDVDDEDQEYKETTFAQLRAQMQEMKDKMKSGDGEEKENPETKVNVKFDVARTGEKKTINGFDCEHVIVTLTVEEENLKTQAKRDVSYFTLDQWLSQSHISAQQELEAFHVKWAKAVGVTDGEMGLLQALMAQYGTYLKELQEKGKEIRGYPVLSTMTIETPGGGKETETEVKEEEEEKPKVSLPGGFGGLFGKKKDKEKEEEVAKKEEPKATEGGKAARTTIFSVTTEVLELITSPVSATEFEVPAGYKKKD